MAILEHIFPSTSCAKVDYLVSDRYQPSGSFLLFNFGPILGLYLVKYIFIKLPQPSLVFTLMISRCHYLLGVAFSA